MSQSQPFLLPAYEVPHKDEKAYTRKFLEQRSVLLGHIYALCNPVPPATIDIFSDLIDACKEMVKLGSAFNNDMAGFSSADFPRNTPEEVEDGEDSEHRLVIRNPLTSAMMAKEALREAIGLVTRIVSGKHDAFRLHKKDLEELTEKISGLLDQYEMKDFEAWWDPKGAIARHMQT